MSASGNGCIFCAIAAGRTPARIVHEDPELLAFLDSRPLFWGHCLVVPRAHHETLLDLPDELALPVISLTKRIGRALEATLGAEGFFVANNNRVSQSVPHLHVHVIPRRKKDGLKGFFWPRQPYRDEAHAAEVAEQIRAALSR